LPTPSNPTADEIIEEALAQAGESDPDTTLLARAEIWLSQCKNDIWKRAKKLTSLQVTSHGVVTKGQSRLSYPSDFSSDLELTLLTGNTTGTAQSGSTSSITLASDDTNSEDNLIGKEILVTGGTGVGSLSQVIAFNSTTKVATVAPNFNSAPGSGSTYLVVEREIPLEMKPINQFKMYHRPGRGVPRCFFPIGDEDYGEFIFDVAPDLSYGARLRYYANVMKIDTDSTTMSTLYSRWQNIFIEGIKWRRFADADDDRADGQWQLYQRELNTLISRETYGVDLSNLTDSVGDFR
jgi:hypothetical protein